MSAFEKWCVRDTGAGAGVCVGGDVCVCVCILVLMYVCIYECMMCFVCMVVCVFVCASVEVSAVANQPHLYCTLMSTYEYAKRKKKPSSLNHLQLQSASSSNHS